jgi:hypothetical protein
MEHWEYYTLVIVSGDDGPAYPVTEECNKLGDKGWELVSCLPETKSKHAMLIFKRRKARKKTAPANNDIRNQIVSPSSEQLREASGAGPADIDDDGGVVEIGR